MNISIIGGDQRIIELARIIQNNKRDNLYLYGIDETDIIKDFQIASSLKEAIDKSEMIITSIPLSKDGEHIYAPFSTKTILISDLFEYAKNKKIITGNISNQQSDNEIIDVLKLEELAVLNAIPTAEGAIQIAIEKSDITLHESNCLVMGFGKIGKILSKMLYGMGANVYCEARKESDIAFIKAYGYNDIYLKDLSQYLGKFDFIFNTIPNIILDKTNLSYIKKECIIIDLASKPGGVDFDYANSINLKTYWALALPRKSGS